MGERLTFLCAYAIIMTYNYRDKCDYALPEALFLPQLPFEARKTLHYNSPLRQLWIKRRRSGFGGHRSLSKICRRKVL
nr:MAG TPA: hypothetical protein [Caudoviricetes sp.]